MTECIEKFIVFSDFLVAVDNWAINIWINQNSPLNTSSYIDFDTAVCGRWKQGYLAHLPQPWLDYCELDTLSEAQMNNIENLQSLIDLWCNNSLNMTLEKFIEGTGLS